VTEELARLAQLAQPIAILAAPGVSPLAWAALYHLRSPLAGGPLVFVEGTDRAYHDVAAWRSAADSPLGLAAGGTLCLLDPQALPVPVQRYLGAALPREIGAVLVLPATVDTMVARDQLEERFADRIGDRSLMLPTLRSRGEDLRGLALDMLTHIGLRHRGEPIGIDLSALAVLGEHDWPGNDAELFGVLTKAALVTTGPTVTGDDLAVSGFVPTSAPPQIARTSSGPTLPKPKRRRRPTEPRR
jgi:DNA-binding NtrC family response regulator